MMFKDVALVAVHLGIAAGGEAGQPCPDDNSIIQSGTRISRISPCCLALAGMWGLYTIPFSGLSNQKPGRWTDRISTGKALSPRPLRLTVPNIDNL